VTTVFTVLFENHDYAEVVGSSNAPYFNSLISKYGLATNYMDSGVHPSLPNYLDLISGDTQGISADMDPTVSPFPKNAQHLGSQLQTKGLGWRSYQESMTTPCKLSASGNYAPKHNPFLYFTDIQGNASLCASTNVDYSQFAADLAAGTNRYFFITPNLLDDGHNPTSAPVTGLKASDAWAQTEIGKILASPAYKNGGVIFITWDEAEGRNGDSKDQIPMIVVSELIKSPGFKSAKAYSHKSYLATVEDILGLPRLAGVASEPNMMEFFQ
jgi:phospholipase C